MTRSRVNIRLCILAEHHCGFIQIQNIPNEFGINPYLISVLQG